MIYSYTGCLYPGVVFWLHPVLGNQRARREHGLRLGHPDLLAQAAGADGGPLALVATVRAQPRQPMRLRRRRRRPLLRGAEPPFLPTQRLSILALGSRPRRSERTRSSRRQRAPHSCAPSISPSPVVERNYLENLQAGPARVNRTLPLPSSPLFSPPPSDITSPPSRARCRTPPHLRFPTSSLTPLPRPRRRALRCPALEPSFCCHQEQAAVEVLARRRSSGWVDQPPQSPSASRLPRSRAPWPARQRGQPFLHPRKDFSRRSLAFALLSHRRTLGVSLEARLDSRCCSWPGTGTCIHCC